MITDDEVIGLYKEAGWQYESRLDTPDEQYGVLTDPYGKESVCWVDASEELTWQTFLEMKENRNDPRHSLDAGFRLLDAIAPRAHTSFFYGMDGLSCTIVLPFAPADLPLRYDGVDPYRPDYTPSRALVMTAAMLLMVSEKGQADAE